MTTDIFRFKLFEVHHDISAMKVGTDAVLLGAWANVNGAKAICDAGTGCGVIALMLAQRNKTALVDAIEVDEQSYQQCVSNFSRSPWPERLSGFYGDLGTFNPGKKYDTVVSNPPFFSNSLLSGNRQRDQARHTLLLSPDQWVHYLAKLTDHRGRMAFVLPVESEMEIKTLASRMGFYAERICKVRYNKHKPVKRILVELSRDAGKCTESELIIYSEPNVYSADYIALAKDFYTFL